MNGERYVEWGSDIKCMDPLVKGYFLDFLACLLRPSSKRRLIASDLEGTRLL